MRSDQSECVICVDTRDLAPGRSVVKCTVPQMIPKPQTIPKIDLKWYSTQVIPKVDHKWIREKLRNGMDCMGLIMKKKLFFLDFWRKREGGRHISAQFITRRNKKWNFGLFRNSNLITANEHVANSYIDAYKSWFICCAFAGDSYQESKSGNEKRKSRVSDSYRVTKHRRKPSHSRTKRKSFINFRI